MAGKLDVAETDTKLQICTCDIGGAFCAQVAERMYPDDETCGNQCGCYFGACCGSAFFHHIPSAECSDGGDVGMSETTQKRKIVYVKAERCSMVSDKKVCVADVAELFSNDKTLERQLKRKVLLVAEGKKQEKYVFSVLRLFEVLSEEHNDVEWVNAGEDEFIVEYNPPKKVRMALEAGKTAFVCLAVFVGSAFTIMTFNQDVAVADVFRMMEELVLGKGVESKVIEIAYSVGLPLGVILFFNHFSRLKIDSDPTPLQVQMRLYEENVNKTVIENASREGRMEETQ